MTPVIPDPWTEEAGRGEITWDDLPHGNDFRGWLAATLSQWVGDEKYLNDLFGRIIPIREKAAFARGAAAGGEQAASYVESVEDAPVEERRACRVAAAIRALPLPQEEPK